MYFDEFILMSSYDWYHMYYLVTTQVFLFWWWFLRPNRLKRGNRLMPKALLFLHDQQSFFLNIPVYFMHLIIIYYYYLFLHFFGWKKITIAKSLRFFCPFYSLSFYALWKPKTIDFWCFQRVLKGRWKPNKLLL